MALFTPGQFRQSLQNKIKAVPDPTSPDAKTLQIKNNTPESFTQQASTYAANEMRQINSQIQSPRSTASLPPDSIMNKSVHERMQAWTKEHSSSS